MSTAAEISALIHNQGKQVVLAITGGGSRAIAELLEVPGASRSVLEAMVPYSAASLVRWLGGKPDRFCAEPTARAMAMAAFQRGLSLAHTADDPRGERLLGVGCTASLVSDRPKRGAHRIHLALQSATCTSTRSLTLVSGARSRAEEEALAASLLLNLLAQGVGLKDRILLPLRSAEQVVELDTIADEAWCALLVGTRDLAQVKSGPEQRVDRRAIFPGAFHPLHVGHRRMAEIAARRLGCPVEFEISVFNVDKPPLDYQEMADRAAQFSAAEAGLWFSRAPTFVEKSRLFPGASFVVGLDTVQRIGQPRYYGGDVAACQQAIEQIAARGGRFLVFGRTDEHGFRSLRDAELPPALLFLCDEVAEHEFREDISSTEIRNRTAE